MDYIQLNEARALLEEHGYVVIEPSYKKTEFDDRKLSAKDFTCREIYKALALGESRNSLKTKHECSDEFINKAEHRYEEILALRKDFVAYFARTGNKTLTDAPVTLLNLSVRTMNILNSEAIDTIEKLLDTNSGALSKIPYMGRKSLNEISDNLNALELSLMN